MSLVKRQPVYYIPHGGGPCFFMDWTLGPADTWEAMGVWLKGLAADLPALPKTILVISAHWEQAGPAIGGHPTPALIYDYYGFPEHTYQLKYPAPGDPQLAEEIYKLLDTAGFDPLLDHQRGLDHGVFIPLKLIFPNAEIPVVSLSLEPDLDPVRHLQIGAALQSIRQQGVLIIGSGLSSHNLSAMMQTGAPLPGSKEFNQWLVETCALDKDARNAQLGNWLQAPSARHVHPREEHLLPLMVAAGAAGSDPGRCVFHDQVMGADAVAIRFG